MKGAVVRGGSMSGAECSAIPVAASFAVGRCKCGCGGVSLIMTDAADMPLMQFPMDRQTALRTAATLIEAAGGLDQ